jgi:hypothetical protein
MAPALAHHACVRTDVDHVLSVDVVVTDAPNHPIIEGTPVLLGDVLHCTDHDSVDSEGAPFAKTGKVVLIADDGGSFLITIKPDEGFTEEFYWPDSEFERVEETA